ncbi:shikimate dehydrogenase [Roseibium sp. MMSF_3544]|uniref:shikimate dehydrogenase family protein n=1 Tax=unclassified Roseibium TaxID=2629323 RepID=UPI00273DDD9E|nr:hypothetical protein [Roseibium sp. MMSF_3544]
MKIAEFLENEPGLDAGKRYAGIIGLSPSKGARSPLLWNAAFQAFDRAERMVPMDVLSENLEKLLEYLAADTDFIGGAVAVPYKEDIATWLGAERLTPQAQKIGAVNCLFRNEAGILCGTNTDGEAALTEVCTAIPDLSGVKVLLLGPGGAGKAVAAYLADAGASLTIVSRTPEIVQDFCNKISASIISYDQIKPAIADSALIVNCTPVGFANGVKDASPLDASDLDQANSDVLVYDIVYDPLQTPLLEMAESRGLAAKNGLNMNFLQAVHGFSKASGLPDLERISGIMKGAV